MKIGRFPGQEEALRDSLDEMRVEARKEGLRAGRAIANRRMFLGLAVGGALGACTSLAASGAGAEQEPARATAADPTPDTAWMRELARGPLDDLCRSQVSYVVTVTQRRRVDDVIWGGVARLTNALIEGDARIAPALARAIALLESRAEPPASMQFWFDLLRAHSNK